MRYQILGFMLSGILGLNAQASIKQIQVKGSDTEVNLVQSLAEKFMEKTKTVSISVSGGGSGVGIAALLNSTADLANSSRAVKADEEEQGKKVSKKLHRVIFATDGLTVVVHDSNSIKHLTVEQVGKVFRGEISNWKDLGGPDLKISLYGRQSNSGTFTFFRDAVVKGDYSTEMKSMNGSSQISEAVMQDKAAIGYTGVGYVVDLKTKQPRKGLGIVMIAKDANSKPINPLNAKAVISGEYPISRPLFQYFTSSDKELIGFLKYELSPAGRKLVTEAGFYDIKKEWQTENDTTFKGLAGH